MAPLTVSVEANGNVADLVASLGREWQDGNLSLTFGSAVGNFSTSTDVDPPQACGDFANATPGQCPFNPQIALLTAGTVLFITIMR